MRLFPILLLSLAACPAPVKEPTETETGARFADATDAERGAAFQAALGFGAVWATLIQMQADGDARSVDEDNNLSGCPSYEVLVEEPFTVRYEADACTGPSGATWDGVLEAENPLTWEDTMGEPAGAMRIVAEQFSMQDGPMALTFDGTWSQTDTAIGADSTASYDLVAGIGPHIMTLVGDMAITWEDGVTHTTCVDGLRGAVEGLGDFDVSCDMIDFGSEDGVGFVEMKGVDTLRVELTPDAEGCLPTWIDGVASEPLCMDTGGEEPTGDGSLDSDVFGMSGIGCVDGEFFLDAQTLIGEVERVEIALAVGEVVEVHGLAGDPEWTNEEYDGWTVALTQGAYEAGVSTVHSCDDVMERMDAVFFAYDANDELVGCQINGFAEDAGAVDVSACPRHE